MYSKLSDKQNMIKVVALLSIFLTTPNEVEKNVKTMQSNSSDRYVHRSSIDILNLFDAELQLINTKPMIENKLKEFLSELKKFKLQIISILEYEKRNDCKIFHSSTNLIASVSEINETFIISMHRKILTRTKLCH